MTTLTTEELREIVRESVKETLTSLGIQTADPIEMQRDFQFVRDMRTSTRSARAKVYLTLMGAALSGIGFVVWEGVRSVLQKLHST